MELQCYNRGCGKKYDPNTNTSESCRHHPGQAVFHDAYKGWSCCNKKSTDFTEFLNIKGCTLSQHSNIKVEEPEKPKLCNIPDTEVIEVKPIVRASLPRPALSTSMIKLIPDIAASLKKQIITCATSSIESTPSDGTIAIGTACKNSACTTSYTGPSSDDTPCVHHPGVPIFHEGLKFWSCCQKRTSDFDVFLKQVGCTTGTHTWIKEDKAQTVNCRWDYHQTGTHVIVSIYAKSYCATQSEVQLNPIRLLARVVFPQENNAVFVLDRELFGIVDVGKSNVSMYGTKVEIKLKKAEPGSWPRLEAKKNVIVETKLHEEDDEEEQEERKKLADTIGDLVEAVDLSDL